MNTRSFHVFRLTFPKDLSLEPVTAVLASIAALQRPKGPFGVPIVGFEVVASSQGIEHLLLVEEAHAQFVLGQLRTHLTGLRIEPVSELGGTALSGAVAIGAELRMTHHGRLLRQQSEQVATAILGSLGGLKEADRVTVQWLLAPRVRPKPGIVKMESGHPDGLIPERQPIEDLEKLRARERKLLDPLLSGIGRVAVQAATAPEATRLIKSVLSAIRSSEAPGVSLVNRFVSSAQVVRRVRDRTVPLLDWGLTLNVREAAGLLGLPYGALVAEGVSVGTSVQLPPRPEVPSAGPDFVQLGVSSFPGLEARVVGLLLADRLQHFHSMGPTGTGKSTLLARLCQGDIEAGRGVVVLDPKGDLVADLLDRIPEHRRDDVIVLDPMAKDLVVGFNPLNVGSTDRHVIDRAVDFVVGTLHQLYEKTWGPRTEDTLRAACLSLVLASDPEKPYTLCDLTELLVGSKEFRSSIVSTLTDRDLLLFWAWFEKLPGPEKLTMLGPVLNKLRAFTLRIAIRNVIGQSKGLDFGQMLATNKILLVPLPKGVIGQETAALLGSLLVSSLWQAALERAELPPEQRTPVMVTLDEVQEFLRLPGDLGDVLTQARGLGMGMTLAHQHLGQLPKELAAAVNANARSKLFFQLSDSDARAVAPLAHGWLTADDLVRLPVREAVLIPLVNSNVLPPCTIRTLPLGGAPNREQAKDIRRASAQRYGRAPVQPVVRSGTAEPSTRPVRRPRKVTTKSSETTKQTKAPLSGGDS